MHIDLKATLRERGLRQKHIAEPMQVSEATISQWAAALRAGNFARIPAEKALKLAGILGVAPSALRPDLWPAINHPVCAQAHIVDSAEATP